MIFQEAQIPHKDPSTLCSHISSVRSNCNNFAVNVPKFGLLVLQGDCESICSHDVYLDGGAGSAVVTCLRAASWLGVGSMLVLSWGSI